MSNPIITSVARPFDDRTSQSMTITGTTIKTAILTLTAAAAATWSWMHPTHGALLIGSALLALLVVIVAGFVPKFSPVLAPIYAVLEGYFIGAISALYANAYNGIVAQAVVLTFGILFTLLALYQCRLITVTAKFRSFVMIATIGIGVAYLLSFVLRLFGVDIGLFRGSALAIGFSLVVVVIASLNLLLDFDYIEQGVANGAPKYMEWFAALGLLITIVWLYLELLRLLAILKGRD